MDLGPDNPILFGAFMFGMVVMTFYGFGLALMYALSWMGDTMLRPVIAYALPTAGIVAWYLPSRQWLVMAALVLIGGGCMAVHMFAVIGRRIPDPEAPREPIADEDSDEDDEEADSR